MRYSASPTLHLGNADLHSAGGAGGEWQRKLNLLPLPPPPNMQTNTVLEVLEVNGNVIDLDGITAIAEALAVNTSLRVLRVRCGGVGRRILGAGGCGVCTACAAGEGVQEGWVGWGGWGTGTSQGVGRGMGLDPIQAIRPLGCVVLATPEACSPYTTTTIVIQRKNRCSKHPPSPCCSDNYIGALGAGVLASALRQNTSLEASRARV